MNKQKPYVAEPVPSKYLAPHQQSEYGEIWYCHMRGYPQIPVMSSIGDKKIAKEAARLRNQFSCS